MKAGWIAVWLLGCGKPAAPQAAADAVAARPPPAVKASGPLDVQVNEAVDAMASGSDADLDRAIAILQPLVDQDTTLVAAYDLGVAYLRRNRHDAAADLFHRVTAAQPTHGDGWLGLATARARAGRLQEALDAAASGVVHAPDHAGLRVAQVDLLRQSGQPTAAMATAKEALALHAKSLALYNAYGLACLDAGELGMGKFVFQKALQELDGAPLDPVLQTNLGWSFYLDDDKAAATEHLSKALALDPRLVPAMVYLSRVYMDDHNYADAVPLLEGASGLEPRNADLQLTLGVAYRGVGRLDEARVAYERALALAPANPAPFFNLGILFGDYQKRYDDGVAALEKYVAAGGPEAARAQTYISDLQAEKKLAQQRAEAEAERKEREAERARKEELAAAPIEPTPSEEPAPVVPAEAAPEVPSEDVPAAAPLEVP